MNRLPNFVHVGAGKAGSTWVHEVLSSHPDVFLTDAKDIYFFSRYYDRGLGWYANHFRHAPEDADVVGEVCPGYLWFPEAASRMRSSLGGDVRVMATLRDPVTRAFSAYLYERKHGLADTTFRQALDAFPQFIDEGRYHTHLERYVREFGPERVHVTLFDDLQADPQSFLDEATEWLGISRLVLSPEALEPQLPASRPRSALVARGVKRVAEVVRGHDGAELIGRIKRSAIVQRALYAPLGEDARQVPTPEADRIKETLASEISRIESMFGIPLRAKWGW